MVIKINEDVDSHPRSQIKLVIYMYMYTVHCLPQFIYNVMSILHIADFREHLQFLHLHIGRVIVPEQHIQYIYIYMYLMCIL